jgi:hypothetical protein
MNGLTSVWNQFEPPPIWFDPATFDRIERQLAGNGEHRSKAHNSPPPLESPPFGGATVDMLLYVSGSSLSSSRAALALQAVLREFPSEAVRLRIVDVCQDMEGATRDRVLFTPTLIFVDQQQRKTRLLGDLSNTKVLWDLLLSAGLEPI